MKFKESVPPKAIEWEDLFCDAFLINNYEIIRFDRQRIELSTGEGVILGVLAQARGQWKARPTLAGAIYGGGEWVNTWDGVIRCHMSKLIKKTEGCTFTIESDRHCRNLGYRLNGHLRVIA